MGIEKELDEIGEVDLLRLIEEPVFEGKALEYKKTLELKGSEEQKRKLISGVASFANAAGGDMIFGMHADNGRAISLHPLAGFDPDATLLTLRDLLRAHLAPKVFGIGFQSVVLDEGGYVLIVRIPKTGAGPHMVTYGNDNRFYSRDGNGRVLMDVNEVRAAFSLTEATAERIRRFRLERLGDIIADETPVVMGGKARVVLHFCPLASFEAGYRCDLEAVIKHPQSPLRPMGSSNRNLRYDFDGYYAYAGSMQEGHSDAYTKLFRNGCIEAVESDSLDDSGKVIASVVYERNLLEGARSGLQLLKLAGVPPPVLLMLSLVGVKGYEMAVGGIRGISNLGRKTIARDQLIVPEVATDSLDLDEAQFIALMRRLLDPVWNACGWAGSHNFDAEGRWKH